MRTEGAREGLTSYVTLNVMNIDDGESKQSPTHTLCPPLFTTFIVTGRVSPHEERTEHVRDERWGDVCVGEQMI